MWSFLSPEGEKVVKSPRGRPVVKLLTFLKLYVILSSYSSIYGIASI